MRERVEILDDLIHFRGDISLVEKELRQYPWDSEILITISTADLATVLNYFIISKTSFTLIEDWANAIECREDIEFETQHLQEVVVRLANPLINEPITLDLLESFLKELE